MGSPVPKQFMNLNGKPVLWYTLNAFLDAYDDLEIVLVVPEDHLQTGEIILQSTTGPGRIILTPGGQNRFLSVKNGLQHVQHSSIVSVHDGVRCLVSKNLIHRCYAMALEQGNAVPAIRATDSIRFETVMGNEVLNRDQVKIIQTPQTFFSDLIKAGYEQPFTEAFTDEASVVEKLGIKINLVEGEETNIKITRPMDIIIAEKILENRSR